MTKPQVVEAETCRGGRFKTGRISRIRRGSLTILGRPDDRVRAEREKVWYSVHADSESWPWKTIHERGSESLLWEEGSGGLSRRTSCRRRTSITSCWRGGRSPRRRKARASPFTRMAAAFWSRLGCWRRRRSCACRWKRLSCEHLMAPNSIRTAFSKTSRPSLRSFSCLSQKSLLMRAR